MNQITYIAKSKIPSRHANSVQVVNMICAFALFTERLDAYLPGGLSHLINRFAGKLFSNYGYKIPNNVKIHLPSRLNDEFEDRVLQKLPASITGTIITRSQKIALRLSERKFPVLFESHAFSRDISKIPISKFVNSINTSPAAGIISISKEISDAYIKQGLSPKRILTSPDAVNLDSFTRPNSGGLGKLFGKTIYERPVMVYTGSLSKEKGAQFLIEAAAALPQINIALIGGSPYESKILNETYAKHTANIFIHPNIPHKDVPSVLHDASILVMPYLPEGTFIPYMSPLKLFEYLATGKPILSAQLPVFSQFLIDEHNCLFFEAGLIDSFCERARKLLEMPPEQITELRNNQLRTVEHSSWEYRAKTILDWHRSILNGRNQL